MIRTVTQKAMLSGILLFFITAAVYARTGGHQFINLDDALYILENPVVKTGLSVGSIGWAFTSTFASNWHPVTWLSHMLDVQLFGLNPAGHHLMNVILHAVSALLLYYVLTRITSAPWQSLFVAAMFALHPLHVESVAWVAERKDTLSGIFWTLTLLLYARYAEKPGTGRYLTALLCFAIGLMSKPMLVTLPLILLLLDYWPLNRLRSRDGEGDGEGAKLPALSLLKEKIPFLLLSALSSGITIHAQHQGGSMANLEKAPLLLRGANAIISYARYIVDTVWPRDLAVLYPFPNSIDPVALAGAALLLAMISGAVFIAGHRAPWLRVGWLWFLVTLLPVIGLIQVGGQARADRYTYIPLTGLFIMAAWGVPPVLERWRHCRKTLAIAALSAVCALTVVTWRQIGIWKDSATLFRHTLAVTSNNHLIHNNYGNALSDRGDLQAAMLQYREALRILPRSHLAHNNLGMALTRQGRYAEAIGHFRDALTARPDYLLAMVNLGNALSATGKTDEALAQYLQALKLDPMSRDANLNLALLYMKTGNRDEAIRHYDTVVNAEPRSPLAPLAMGIGLAQQGKLDEASGFLSQALQLAPDSADVHFNMGVFLARQGRNAEAREHFARALKARPDSITARQWLQQMGQP